MNDALRLIDEWVGPQGPPGVAAAVWHRGGVVAERCAGEARPGEPVTEETLFALASVTKPIAAATVMTMVEEGLVSLDEPAGRIVPEFRAGPEGGAEGANPGLERLRQTISARQLLCHVSGLPEDIGARDTRYQEEVSLDVVIDQMCRLPLQSAPGAELRYSNAGYGVLARLAERVGKRPFWALTDERVLSPLGLRDIVPNPSGHVLDRVAIVADSSHAGTDVEAYNSAYWRALALPWGGLFGTARDTVRFGAAFLPSGERILCDAGAAMMAHDQTLGVPGGVESAKVRWEPGAWGLGWEVKGDKRRHWTGELTAQSTFCHFGHAGTLLWGDPEQDLALAVLCNRTVTHMWAFVLARWARLSNAVVAAANS